MLSYETLSGADLANVRMSMNPFNEVAVEEAIRLKEKGRRVGDLVCFDRRQANARNATHGADNVGGSCDLGCDRR